MGVIIGAKFLPVKRMSRLIRPMAMSAKTIVRSMKATVMSTMLIAIPTKFMIISKAMSVMLMFTKVKLMIAIFTVSTNTVVSGCTLAKGMAVE